jgi:hypothetical protein
MLWFQRALWLTGDTHSRWAILLARVMPISLSHTFQSCLSQVLPSGTTSLSRCTARLCPAVHWPRGGISLGKIPHALSEGKVPSDQSKKGQVFFPLSILEVNESSSPSSAVRFLYLCTSTQLPGHSSSQ